MRTANLKAFGQHLISRWLKRANMVKNALIRDNKNDSDDEIRLKSWGNQQRRIYLVNNTF